MGRLGGGGGDQMRELVVFMAVLAVVGVTWWCAVNNRMVLLGVFLACAVLGGLAAGWLLRW